MGASGINQVVSMIAGGVLGAAGSVAGDIIAVNGDLSQLNVWKVVGKAAIMGAIGVGLGRWTGAGYKKGSLAWAIAENLLGPIVIPFYFWFGY